jgi:FkbM family methyltransferase
MKNLQYKEALLNQAWVFGAGEFAKGVRLELEQSGINVLGFFTSTAKLDDSERHSIEDVLSKPAPVYLGIFNHKDEVEPILQYLAGYGIYDVITPGEFFKANANSDFSVYYLTSRRDQLPSPNQIADTRKIFKDSTSLNVFDGFLNYQKDGTRSSLVRSARAEIQYLGKTLDSPYRELWLSGDLRWVDVGAFDGDTIQALHDNFESNTENKFICMEPDQENYIKLLERIQALRIQARALNVAAGETKGTLRFMQDGSLSSKVIMDDIQSKNIVEISVESIDDICSEFRPTHLKMDIEGAEMSALKGAIKTLKESRPRIAVSLYHKPLDIVEIPLFLSNLLPSYSWFIRCYGAHGYDTILYGIPE